MVLADWNMQNPLLSISAYIVIRAFLLILKTHERMFGKCLCETCSTVNTWPYFFERVLSGQKLGYTWKDELKKCQKIKDRLTGYWQFSAAAL